MAIRKVATKGLAVTRFGAMKRPFLSPISPIDSGYSIRAEERVFLEAIERGDLKGTMRAVTGLSHSPININCTNMMGRTGIQIAVDNENVEIVAFLLRQPDIHIGDAILYAIQEGNYIIVEMLIHHPSITKDMLGTAWSKTKTAKEESPDFSPDISPVILAATCNQFEILQLILSLGAKIERPHQISCSCRKCKERYKTDSLRHSLLRTNTYRALASPAWISLTSKDPILTAFKLSWELKCLASKESEYKETFCELSDQCRKYACQLLDQCRSSEEVIAVLNRSDTGDRTEDLDSGFTFGSGDHAEKLSLTRLNLALKYEQKQFVAHPHCQQLLTTIWYAGLPGWRKQSIFLKALKCLLCVTMLPVLAAIYLIYPQSRVGQLLRNPFIKFLNHSASFAIFLVLLLTASTDWGTTDKQRHQVRGPKPETVELLILWWVIGFVWAEMKQIWEEGFYTYVRQWWNWLDFSMLALYLMTLSLRLVAYFLRSSGKYGTEEVSRLLWPASDPTLLSESLFAIANIFSFSRIIFLFQVNEHLGPLQISLGCMLVDFTKFIFIFYLVITSFACGLNQLYFYYTFDSTVVIDAFSTLLKSYVSLFWSLFEVSHRKEINIVSLKNITDSKSIETTQRVAEIMLIMYHFMAIIVLINVLIAMMSNSFQNIQNDADCEWKFARSKLWMGYFDDGSTLPPPLNTIVSPKSIYYCLKSIKNLIVACLNCKLSRNKITRRNHIVEAIITGTNNFQMHENSSRNSAESREPARTTYQQVMQKLVNRYIHWTKKHLLQGGVNEDDILEIKQDISSLRYELRDDRRQEISRTIQHLERLKQELIQHLGHQNEISLNNQYKSIEASSCDVNRKISANFYDTKRQIMMQSISNQSSKVQPSPNQCDKNPFSAENNVQPTVKLNAVVKAKVQERNSKELSNKLKESSQNWQDSGAFARNGVLQSATVKKHPLVTRKCTEL